jgi:hypothetical protein
VLVANLGRGPDGRWTALDGRRLYAQARTASFVYQAVLRGELSRSLGVEWLTVRDGIAELAGVPRHVLRAFSRRRADIEAALEDRGTSGPRAAEAAALATRRPKDRAMTAERLAGEWRERATEIGFGPSELERVTGTERDPPRQASAERAWERAFELLGSPIGLTRSRSTFDRRDVIQALCEHLPVAETFDARTLEQAADRFLASGLVVPLLPVDGSFRRADGRLLPLAREQLRYSTPELLALEQRLIDHAAAGAEANVGVARADDVAAAIATRPTMSDEQRRMGERLCGGGELVSVVAGKAGSGKTFALAGAREAWQATGHPVLGVTVARRAARELQTGAGIATTSITALLARLARGGEPLPDGVVLVVDEAGMVATRQLAALLEHVERAAGKLVLVGDHRQLPELEAGGAFRALVARGHAIELTHNQRQTEPWERRTLDQISNGEPEPALEQYAAHDRVHINQTSDETRRSLVADWARAHGPGADAVMLAHRRADVVALNTLARDHLAATGVLHGPELRLPGGAFAAGDHVVMKRNQPALGINNGDRGRVLVADGDNRFLLVEAEGQRVRLDADYLYQPTERGDPSLLHGYAITCHVAQGITVDHAYLLADHGLSRELGYTALSRGRHTNHLYATRQLDDPHAEIGPTDPNSRDPIERLAIALSTSTAQQLAIDTPDRDLAEAQRRHLAAGAARHAIEQSPWRPGRRHRLAAARKQEDATARELAHAQRAQAEQRHAAQPFTTDREATAQLDQLSDQRIQRRLQQARDHEKARGRGRELGL